VKNSIAHLEGGIVNSGLPMHDRGKYAGRRILVVDDDLPLAGFLKHELEAESFVVDMVHDGEAALNSLLDGPRYDLLITALNLQKLDGVSLVLRVRPLKPRLPIIVLTVRNRLEDKVAALQNGADDFIVKPFSLVELRARVIALLRRSLGAVENISSVGDLTIHREEHKVERNGRRIDLTPREFAILEYMMRNAGRPVSRATLFEEVWNAPHDPSTNIVDVYMKYVRDKVDLPGERKLTRTIRGVGYELSDA
jgi:two-component system copper resistance phosphate regulon response regulator CusR